MLTKGMARPAARKGSGSKAKKTVAVASRKSEPIIQMVERRSSPNLLTMTKKVGELPIPTATFVF
jgi:hypothetical protein